jgi:hypothetical protein
MRSVSALVKPPIAATAITVKIATASGSPAARERSASQVIGRPRTTRNATGDPNSQNQ